MHTSKNTRKGFPMINKRKISVVLLLVLFSFRDVYSMESVRDFVQGSWPAALAGSAFVLGCVVYFWDSVRKDKKIKELDRKFDQLRANVGLAGLNTPEARAGLSYQLYSTAMQSVDNDLKRHSGEIRVLEADRDEIRNFLNRVFLPSRLEEPSDNNRLPTPRNIEDYVDDVFTRNSIKGLSKPTESGGLYSSLGIVEYGEGKGKNKDEKKKS